MAKKKLTPEQAYEANKKSLQTLLEKKQVIEDNGGALKPDDSRQITYLKNELKIYEKELELSKLTTEERDARAFKLNGYDINKVSKKFKDFAMYMIFGTDDVQCYQYDGEEKYLSKLKDLLKEADWVSFNEDKRYFVVWMSPVENGKYSEKYYRSLSEEEVASEICNPDPFEFANIEGIFDMDNPIYDEEGLMVKCSIKVTGWEIAPAKDE